MGIFLFVTEQRTMYVYETEKKHFPFCVSHLQIYFPGCFKKVYLGYRSYLFQNVFGSFGRLTVLRLSRHLTVGIWHFLNDEF